MSLGGLSLVARATWASCQKWIPQARSRLNLALQARVRELLESQPEVWAPVKDVARLLRTRRASIKGLVWTTPELAAWPRGWGEPGMWLGG